MKDTNKNNFTKQEVLEMIIEMKRIENTLYDVDENGMLIESKTPLDKETVINNKKSTR